MGITLPWIFPTEPWLAVTMDLASSGETGNTALLFARLERRREAEQFVRFEDNGVNHRLGETIGAATFSNPGWCFLKQ